MCRYIVKNMITLWIIRELESFDEMANAQKHFQ
jgi:hypothetical protein